MKNPEDYTVMGVKAPSAYKALSLLSVIGQRLAANFADLMAIMQVRIPFQCQYNILRTATRRVTHVFS